MGFDGYAVLAILTLFFVYLFPSLIRSAQVVAQARIEDRFSGGLQIIATAGQKPEKEVSSARTYLHPQRNSEHPMTTPVARKLAAADARRVAAARADRAAAASRRVAASKRRMLLLSVLGALSISGWILTAMVHFTWVVPVLFTALTVGAVELGRRAAAAGAKADAELAQKVRAAEARAGLTPGASSMAGAAPAGSGARTPRNRAPRAGGAAGASGSAASAPDLLTAPLGSADARGAGREGHLAASISSLRVAVDPAKLSEHGDSWTPVPVPPPAYTMKAEVRRKVADAVAHTPAAGAAPDQVSVTPPAEMDPNVRVEAPSSPETSAQPGAPEGPDTSAAAETREAPRGSDAASAPGAVAGSETEEPHATTGSLNVQEILARRRAVG